jgi:hypothetical protein
VLDMLAPQFIREKIVETILERRAAGRRDSAGRFAVKSGAG